MKTSRLTGFLALTLTLCSSLLAAGLNVTTAVHSKADENAPVISYLKAGSTPVVSKTQAPAGWTAVEISGPFEAYVLNKDLNKSLDVRPGAVFRSSPKLEAPILATMEAGDKFEITGLRGKWTQVKVSKTLTGFIRGYAVPAPATAPVPFAAPLPATPKSTALPAPVAAPTPAPMSPAPVPATAYGVSSGGQAAPMINLGDGGSSALPRSFQGKFVSTRRPFAPRRPYDYQINDDAGVRFAYLDLSKLMLTENLENYIDRGIVVHGTARNFGENRDIVIVVESLQLK